MFANFSLRNLRQRDIAIIFIVLSVAGAALWYFYMYQPTQDRITELEGEIASVDTRIQQGRNAQRVLPDLRLAVSALEQDRRDFLAELPLESEIASLIDQLRTSAADANVQINSFGQGGGGENIQDVRPIGFNVAATAPFFETMAFLSSLEELRRFTKINQVSLGSSEAFADPVLNSAYNFTVYVFTGTDPGELQ
jgi:type IV pilus assembly protein PilO